MYPKLNQLRQFMRQVVSQTSWILCSCWPAPGKILACHAVLYFAASTISETYEFTMTRAVLLLEFLVSYVQMKTQSNTNTLIQHS